MCYAVSRLFCESESFKMYLILDVNTQLYPVSLGNKFRLQLTTSLREDGLPDDGDYLTTGNEHTHALYNDGCSYNRYGLIANQWRCGHFRWDSHSIPLTCSISLMATSSLQMISRHCAVTCYGTHVVWQPECGYAHTKLMVSQIFLIESDSSLADAFEYVMYGKIYRIEDDKDGKL